MKITRAGLLALFSITCLGSMANAQAVISLGTAANYGVIAGTSITNTGTSSIIGDLGVSPGATVTGITAGDVTGTIHLNDAAAATAVADAKSAYNVLAAETHNTDLSGVDLGSHTLAPGVYFFSSSAQLTGKLTLDAGGNSSARFDFLIGSTLTSAASSEVALIGSASASNVFWQVGTSATLGTGTLFSGNMLANTSINIGTNSTLLGTAAALNGTLTLDTNTITASPGGAGPAVPEPADTALLMAGIVGVIVIVSRLRGRIFCQDAE